MMGAYFVVISRILDREIGLVFLWHDCCILPLAYANIHFHFLEANEELTHFELLDVFTFLLLDAHP